MKKEELRLMVDGTSKLLMVSKVYGYGDGEGEGMVEE